MDNWFNTNCRKTSTSLASWTPSDDGEEYNDNVDVALRNDSGTEAFIVVHKMTLVNYLKQVYSFIPSGDEETTLSLDCECQEKPCSKKLIFSYQNEHQMKFHIENSDHSEAVILSKNEVNEFWKSFEN